MNLIFYSALYTHTHHRKYSVRNTQAPKQMQQLFNNSKQQFAPSNKRWTKNSKKKCTRQLIHFEQNVTTDLMNVMIDLDVVVLFLANCWKIESLLNLDFYCGICDFCFAKQFYPTNLAMKRSLSHNNSTFPNGQKRMAVVTVTFQSMSIYWNWCVIWFWLLLLTFV